ncbi:MAG: radical SAM protein, partial [Candidatus Aenigmatarchaeota archaeon]
MKVLFIVPTPGYGLIEDNKKVMKRTAGFFPPLGVAFLATTLETKGHKCKIIDMQVTQLTRDQLVSEIKSFAPDAVCLSVLTALAPEAFKIAKIVKENFKVPVICGGQHVSLFPKETLSANRNIDFIVYGEGEIKLLNLIEAIEKGKDIKDVKGIFYRDGNKIIVTENVTQIENLDELPIPSRKFFDMKKYVPVSNQYKRMPVTNMITSRGCTYRICKFCSESGELHSEYRRNSVNRAIEEVKYLIDDYKIREIYFWDDEFVMGNKWVEDFCNELKKEKFDLTWSCYAKVNYVNSQILNHMSSAGCWNIFYGLESGSQDLLNNIKKGQTIKQMRDAVKWTQDAGIEAKGCFMLGLPGETPD